MQITAVVHFRDGSKEIRFVFWMENATKSVIEEYGDVMASCG
jgi:hypothetical protein